MSKVKDQKFTILKNKPKVITRAVFWRIPHNSRDDDICLKIGRYKKPKNWDEQEEIDELEPKSELTLDGDEFTNLIAFLRENYEAFKEGAKTFIPLDNHYDKGTASQVKALLNIPDRKKILEFLLSNNIIPEDLEVGLTYARRARAIDEFNRMLEMDDVENEWQKWFQTNSWVLGSDFVKVLDERAIDTKNITDFLMKSYDGFLDIVEIKRPEGNLQFWASAKDHDNWIPHMDLIKAITQASIYIHEIEREANDLKFFERVGVKAIKPRCTLIYGRSQDWDKTKQEAFRVLNSNYHNLSIMTYDHVLDRAKRIIGKD